MSDKILLTGGSGFIGSQVIDIALSRGYQVKNLDINAPRDPSHRISWEYADVRDANQIEQKILEFSPVRILHLASDIDVSIQNLEDFKTTIDGTANVLAAAKKLPELKRFIHTSTQFVVMPGIQPVDEHYLEPYTVYGQAKAITEKMVWDSQLEIPWYILRPTIIWGPHHPSFAKQIFKHISRRHYLHPVGREPIVRAYGYVTNVAEQMMSFATIDSATTHSHVFYLGDESIDYDVWADAFSIGLTGKPARRIPISLLHALGLLGDIAKMAKLPSPIDSGRAFRMSTTSKIDLNATHMLVGKPKVNFDDGVKETLSWLSSLR